MRLAARAAIWLFGLWLALLPATAEELTGAPRIIDGDTLVLRGTIIRLHGIDAPETGQRCRGTDGKMQRPGDASVSLLQTIAKSGLTCSGTDRDDYGRLIARCRAADGEDIGRRLVAEGLAWAFVKYAADYSPEEAEAREVQRGVWAMDCQPPWDFRAKRWEAARQQAPQGCPIKGNISRNGRIYHTPWSRDYSRTRIDTAKGERWFCSEKEALAAGWRAPVSTGR
jgi:endonuclease YncB( thermonuclease family)